MVRKQLQSRLGVDLSHRKAFIKEQVSSLQKAFRVSHADLSPTEMAAGLSRYLNPISNE